MTFTTIEAFEFTVDDDIVYEEERIEALDFTWTEEDGDLDDIILTECQERLKDITAMIVITPRDYVTYDEDGEVEDYGGGNPETFIWTNNELLTEDQYIG
mgnify:CR=1 FL=1